MGILLRPVALSLALCAAAMGQEPVMKPPVANQDLSNNPLLAPRSLPVPPVPDLTRIGVTGGAFPLSLNDAIRRALENNNNIEISRDNVRLADTTLRSLQGVYDPIINITPQFSDLNTASVNSTGTTSSGILNQKFFTLSPSVTQQFSTGGGQYQVFFDGQRATSNSGITQLSPFYSTTAGITFTQPLLRDRSIDRYRHDIRVQRKRLTQSDFDFRLSTIAVIAQVQQAYWELVFALRDQQNQLSNVNLAREQLRMIEERISVGASAALERAQALAQIATNETNLLTSTQYVTTVENALKQLILRNTAAGEWSACVEPTDQPSFDTAPVNLQDAVKAALANRPELSRLRLEQDINGIDIKLFRNQTLPRVDVQSTISSTGFAGAAVQRPLISGDPLTTANVFLFDQVNQLRSAQGLPAASIPLVTGTEAGNLVGGYGQALRNLWDARAVTVGVAIQFPLRNRTAEANLAGANVQREQLSATIAAQEQVIEADVRNAAQAVDITRRQVLTARAARESAEVQLAGEQKRFQTGLSTTFLVFQYQTQLVNARTAELRSEANYNQAIASLQRATSTTLRDNNVTVVTPPLK
ncbi:MAG: TolC family protein [Acidobacteriota bacterium]